MSLNKTQIDWVKNPDDTQGFTWNPITGCLNNCSYCYARRLANTRLKERYLANDNLAGGYRLARGVLKEGAIPPSLDPFYPRFWEDKILEPWDIHGKLKPKGIFVCDMSDLFGIGIPEKWTGDVLDVIRFSKTHRFYLLTKQPQNLIKFSPFPDNCWVGVSSDGGFDMTGDAIANLQFIEAKVKYLSFEPLLNENMVSNLVPAFTKAGIKWVILGSQTKPYKPPEISWVREIVEACDKAGVPVFLKDNLKLLLPPEVPTFYTLSTPGDDKDQRPIQRQEMPV